MVFRCKSKPVNQLISQLYPISDILYPTSKAGMYIDNTVIYIYDSN